MCQEMFYFITIHYPLLYLVTLHLRQSMPNPKGDFSIANITLSNYSAIGRQLRLIVPN